VTALAAERAHLELARHGQWAEAAQACRVQLLQRPDDLAWWRRLAQSLMGSGECAAAVAALEALLAIQPRSAAEWLWHGYAQWDLRRDLASLAAFEMASNEPSVGAEALIGCCQALNRLGRAEEALRRAVPPSDGDHHAAAWYALRAQSFYLLKRPDAAAAQANVARALDPRCAVVQFVCGLVTEAAGGAQAALCAYDAALADNPAYAAAHLGRARMFEKLHRTVDAIATYACAAKFDPCSALSHLQIGYLEIQMNRFEAAAAAFAAALEREPQNAAAWQGRAQCLAAAGCVEEAAVAYTQLLAIAPETEYMQGESLHARMHCCDWSDFDARRANLVRRVRAGDRVDVPGSFLSHSESPADQLICARTFAEEFLSDPAPSLAPPRPDSPRRLRIAYLSADFHEHATAYLAAGMFEAHDRERFEIFAVSFGPEDGSAMRARLRGAFEHFDDVRMLTDEAIAARLREIGIDIAVDMKGHTRGARPRVFALRCAPVQVSFLAYPGTMGAPFMDYLVADRCVIPEHERIHYAEHPVYMPSSYQVNDGKRRAGPATSRREHGLPPDAFVFACFNAAYKITPVVFTVWMHILGAVPNSVLWLLGGAEVAERNLRERARDYGVDSQRLIFAPWVDADRHLARIALADLVLDTLPYNAHTTASDALWSGVPVITTPGRSFASRVATSLLQALGLAELSTASLEQYRNLAIRLAECPQELNELRSMLVQARDTTRLFDSHWYCRQLESAFEQMVARHRRGEAPSPLYLDDSTRR
jgi:protein O-GlcNAc transferase